MKQFLQESWEAGNALGLGLLTSLGIALVIGIIVMVLLSRSDNKK